MSELELDNLVLILHKLSSHVGESKSSEIGYGPCCTELSFAPSSNNN